MYRTVTANPLLVAQGSHVCLAQETGKGKDRKMRYVLLNSTDLKSQTFDDKDAFVAAVDKVVQDSQKPQQSGGSVADAFETDAQ